MEISNLHGERGAFFSSCLNNIIDASNHILPPFHNVTHYSISHIHIDVNESRHIYLSRFINININVENSRMTYIMKRRK